MTEIEELEQRLNQTIAHYAAKTTVLELTMGQLIARLASTTPSAGDEAAALVSSVRDSVETLYPREGERYREFGPQLERALQNLEEMLHAMVPEYVRQGKSH